MKRTTQFICTAVFLITSCATPNASTPPTDTPPFFVTSTSFVKTSTPTASPNPASFPVPPLVTPIARVGTPSPLTVETISSENVSQISLLGQWGHGVIKEITYSLDGDLVAILTTAGVAIYETNNLTDFLWFLETPVAASKVAFSSENLTLALVLGSAEKIQIWDVTGQRELREFDIRRAGDDYPQFTQFEFSPDGDYLALTVSDLSAGRLRVWKTDSGDLVKEINGGTNFFFSQTDSIFRLLTLNEIKEYRLPDFELASSVRLEGEWSYDADFSADGSKVVLGNFSGWVGVIDTMSGKLIYEIPPINETEPSVYPIYCFSKFIGADYPESFPPPVINVVASGNLFAIQYRYYDRESTSKIILYSLNTGERKDLYIVPELYSFAFAPDTDIFAIGMKGSGAVSFWDLSDKGLFASIQSFETRPYTLRFSTDGNWLAVGYEDATKIRNVSNGEVLRSDDAVVAFAPQGDRFALGLANGEIALAELSGNVAVPFGNTASEIHDLLFAGDGSFIVSTTKECAITIRDSQTGVILKVLEPPTPGEGDYGLARSEVLTLALSANDDLLIGGDEFGSITIWDLVRGDVKSIREVTNGLEGSQLALSPDSTILAVAAGSLNLYDPRTTQLLDQIVLPLDEKYPPQITSVAFSNDGSLLAAGTYDGSVIIFSVPDFEPIYRFQANSQMEHAASVISLAFSPDDSILATGGTDGLVKTWGIP